MENASKALLMAASILLGVMIITVGVALFNSFGSFSSDIAKGIEKKKIQQFNVQFLKYYGDVYNEDTQQTEKIKLTAHDVVSLTNLAQKNNIEYDLQDEPTKSEHTNYVQINLDKNKNLEKSSEDTLTQFIQDNGLYYDSNNQLTTKYFYINSIEVSKKTGRVICVEILSL